MAKTTATLPWMFCLRLTVINIIIALLGSTQPLNGATFTWVGGVDSDIANGANWSPTSTPTAGDVGDFIAVGNPTPTLSNSSVSNIFTIDSLVFTSFPFAQPYTFNIQDPGSTFNFVGSGFSAGVNNDTSTVLQKFNVFNSAQMIFQNDSSACTGNQGPVEYDIGNASTSGSLVFQNQATGGRNTTINAAHGSTITFNDNADGGSAIITAIEGSTITLNNNTSGNSCTFNLGVSAIAPSAGFLNFNDSSGTGGGTSIDAVQGSIINFNNNSHADVASISLGTQSRLNFNDSSHAQFAGNFVPIMAIEGSIITFKDMSTADIAMFSLGESTTHTMASLAFMNFANAKSCNTTAIEGSTIFFGDLANGGSSTITLGTDGPSPSSASLTFTAASNAGASNITGLQASSIAFNGQAQAAGSTINLNDSSVLNFQESSSAGSATIVVGSSATVNLAQTNDQDFNAFLQGTGTVNKTGANKLNVLSDNSAFNGTTFVKQGNLSLNNTLGGNVFVQNTGTISGVGTVGKNLTVGGTIAPGNSIGTLKVNGDYEQQAGSTYQVQVDSTGQGSLIDVAGTALLDSGSGANVTVNGNTQLPSNQTLDVTILHASGGVTGTYSTLTTSNPLISASLTYDPKDVILHFQNTLSLTPGTHNQEQVSDQLQSIANPSQEQNALLTTLALLPPSEAQTALDQMSAAQYAMLLPQAELTNRRFIRSLYSSIRELATIHTNCCNSSCEPIWSIWADSSYAHSSIKNTKAIKGFHIDGYDISLGAYASPNNDLTIGAAGFYALEHAHYNIGGSGKSQSSLGALYTLYRPTGYYVIGDFVFGCNRQRLKRPIDLGSIQLKKQGKSEIVRGTFYVESGKDFFWNCFLVQPFLGVELGFFQMNHFREHSVDPFLDVDVAQKSRANAYSRLGMHVTTQTISCLSLSLDIAWQYRLTSNNSDIKEHFITFGNAFSIDGISWQRSSIDAALNLSTLLGKGWEVYAEAAGQLWQKGLSYTLTGGIEVDW